MWSNSANVRVFATKNLNRYRALRKLKRQPALVKKYKDRSGRSRFQGVKSMLKKSGPLSSRQWHVQTHELYIGALYI